MLQHRGRAGKKTRPRCCLALPGGVVRPLTYRPGAVADHHPEERNPPFAGLKINTAADKI
ncbi:hypothetical protein A6M21_03700 [Desulfotomaculum copahuensis]|uniref:Uncharacterized protein n=1 Tax=Desulfotomaculum copahuensis TaxID=1838280 RepID=A0A1B7LIX7_9FIRM|nr:hypothetical protein A6M21_03700 [Desulfotomaculum copahuensis]